jgi:hypothetical protein
MSLETLLDEWEKRSEPRNGVAASRRRSAMASMGTAGNENGDHRKPSVEELRRVSGVSGQRDDWKNKAALQDRRIPTLFIN